MCVITEQSGGLLVRNRSPIEIIYEERNKLSNRGTETVSFELPGEGTISNLINVVYERLK
jgi:hypothetical protein